MTKLMKAISIQPESKNKESAGILQSVKQDRESANIPC
jgi:hypothetical protein